MFPGRYYPTRYYPTRYYPKTGAAAGASVTIDRGRVTIAHPNVEAAVTFATAQPDANYQVAFGLVPSAASAGLTTVDMKPGTKTTTGFTVRVGAPAGTGESYVVSWILSRAS